ncbi:hypothetical protein M0R72_18475 [Candidatus Pacearchaeota archaeon]|jgi:hypothetical protein|nr:hypothetical protein [Candidatus Pacearchaeota archaeon]
MYEVRLADDIARVLNVDAEKLIIRADPGLTESYVVLEKDGKTVFFAPFDSIISIRTVELCKGIQTN